MSEIENARIESTFLGVEDHGILTYQLHLCGEAWGQSFGGRAFDHTPRDGAGSVSVPEFGQSIRDVLRVVGVNRWEDLPGKHVRAERHSAFSRIERIGHITDDRWTDGSGSRLALESAP